MNSEQIARSVDETWDASIVPTLQRYIRIPNQSPLFDPDWRQNGHMHEAVALGKAWVEEQQIDGLRIERYESKGRTPITFIQVDGDDSSTGRLCRRLGWQ